MSLVSFVDPKIHAKFQKKLMKCLFEIFDGQTDASTASNKDLVKYTRYPTLEQCKN